MIYQVQDPHGQVHEIEGPDNASPDEIMAQAQQLIPVGQAQATNQVESKKPDFASTLYHGALEGGAMTLGGSAGAILGAPAGPIGSAVAGTGMAAAMYPPAKRAAEAIDRMRGIQLPPQENPAKEFEQGLGIEATGAALKPVMSVAGKVVGKVLPGSKVGEMLSGTPANNLRRAFQKGFAKTYIQPESKSVAGEAFGEAKNKLMQDFLAPEEQAAMLVNPRGEANSKIAETYTKFLKGESITPQEAVAARQAIDTVFPPATARNMPRIAKFSEFRDQLNQIVGEKAPDFQKASKDYAASALRSQLSKPFRVNKSNPEEYSKLSGILATLFGAGSVASGTALPAAAYALGTSPLAMGITSSVASDVSRLGANPATMRSLIAAYLANRNSTRKDAR